LPNHVGRFVIFAVARSQTLTVKYLARVLRSEIFATRAATARPDLTAIFLELAHRYAPAEARQLFQDFLESDRFFQSLVSTSPSLQVKFLSVAGRLQMGSEGELLRRILHSPQFAATVGSSRPEEVAPFFAYAYPRAQEEVSALVLALLGNDELTKRADRIPALLTEALASIALQVDPNRTRTAVRGILASDTFSTVVVGARAERIAQALRALQFVGPEYSSIVSSWLVNSEAFRRHLSQTEPEQIAVLFRVLATVDREGTDRLARELLCDKQFLVRVSHAVPLHTASVVRFAADVSEQVAADFVVAWWAHFREGAIPSDGMRVIGCAPMLRIAADFVPSVAREMLAWIESLEVGFSELLVPVPQEMRLGLANVLAEMGHVLRPSQMRALLGR
jgi:hypothetical protein